MYSRYFCQVDLPDEDKAYRHAPEIREEKLNTHTIRCIHGKFVLQPASRASDSARIFCHLKIIENQPCVANQLAYFLCHAVGAFGFD